MSYDLKDLRETADQACLAAIANKGQFDNAAVNWADFGCCGAERWENDEGFTGYTVTIEEADPCNRDVGDFIREHLAASGYPDVNVVFEW